MPAAVTASGTSLTEVSGAGPVIAATVIGDVITVARFPSRDHFAACTGTAPAGASCGPRKTGVSVLAGGPGGWVGEVGEDQG